MSIIGNEKLFYIDLSNEKLYRFNNSLFVEVSKQIQSTSELTNDGEDGANPFITANDLPIDTNLSNSNQTLDSDRTVDGNGKTLTFENTKTLDLDGLIIENKSIRSDNSVVGKIPVFNQIPNLIALTFNTLTFSDDVTSIVSIGDTIRVENLINVEAQEFEVIDVQFTTGTVITLNITNGGINSFYYGASNFKVYKRGGLDFSQYAVALAGGKVFGNNSVAIGENSKIISDSVQVGDYYQCLTVISPKQFELQGNLTSVWSVGDYLYFNIAPSSKKAEHLLESISYDSGNDITTITMATDVDDTYYGAGTITIAKFISRTGLDNSVVIGKNSTVKHANSVVIGNNLVSKEANEVYINKLRLNEVPEYGVNNLNSLDIVREPIGGITLIRRASAGIHRYSFYIDSSETIQLIPELSIGINPMIADLYYYANKEKIRLSSGAITKITIGSNVFFNLKPSIQKIGSTIGTFIEPTFLIEEDITNNSCGISMYQGAVLQRIADYKENYIFTFDIIFNPNYG